MSGVGAYLRQAGNPNPPGRPVGPPGSAMPVYQDNAGAPWDGAAYGLPNAPSPRVINKHADMPSNHFIVSAKVTQPWQGGQQLEFREGQIMFSARSVPIEEQHKQLNMQQLNILARELYAKARADLESGNTPNGIAITAAQFDSLREQEIGEFIAHEELIPEGNPELAMACKLLKISYFRYLLPVGLLYHWNLWGVVNNTSFATSPASKINNATPRTVVVNCVVAKKVKVSNIWGDDKKLIEGGHLGLMIRRAVAENGEPQHTEIVPWSLRDYETAPYSDRGYFDASGRFFPGYYYPLGRCTEVDGMAPPEDKRKKAIGNRMFDRTEIHESLGALPTIWIALNV